MLGLVRVGLYERVYVVQRIEQEMRVQLVLQVLQFGVGVDPLEFLAPVFCPVPVVRGLDRHRDPDCEQIEDYVSRDKLPVDRRERMTRRPERRPRTLQDGTYRKPAFVRVECHRNVAQCEHYQRERTVVQMVMCMSFGRMSRSLTIVLNSLCSMT